MTFELPFPKNFDSLSKMHRNGKKVCRVLHFHGFRIALFWKNFDLLRKEHRSNKKVGTVLHYHELQPTIQSNQPATEANRQMVRDRASYEEVGGRPVHFYWYFKKTGKTTSSLHIFLFRFDSRLKCSLSKNRKVFNLMILGVYQPV